MPTVLDIEGSSPRDYCMLERNFLSHAKLSVILVLFSSAVLLHVRLTLASGPNDGDPMTDIKTLALASIGFITAGLVVIAGYGEYELGFRDIRKLRPSFQASKPQLAFKVVTAMVVFAACIILLFFDNELGQ